MPTGLLASKRCLLISRPGVGAAHVAGKYHLTAKPFLIEGAEKLLELGTRLGKFCSCLTAQRMTTPFDSQWGKYTTFVELAKSEYFASVFAMPFATIFLEAHSPVEERWGSSGNGPEFYERVTREFYDLTAHLYRTCSERPVTFILQHWEGDWFVRGRGGELWNPPPPDWRERCARMAKWLAARQAGAHVVLGDATADPVLVGAGIERARALIAAAGTDSDNVLITMTARLLSPSLPIVSRAEDEATMPKLFRAGATRTVSPYMMAGGRMAEAVLRPAVLDFIEDATRKRRADLQMEEQLVRPGSALDGKTVGTSGLRSWSGLILVAIKRRDGHLAFNPEDDAPVAAGDTLITLGSREQLGRADALAFAR